MTTPTAYDSPEALRSFLKLCLDPGYGIKRTPVRLAEVLPEPLARKAAEFAPHLGGLSHFAQALDEQAKQAQRRAKDAHRAYADALATWIHGEEPKPAPRSMPLLQAVTVAYDAAVSHAAACGSCWPGMRLAEMCADGQRAAIDSQDAIPDTSAECGHEDDDELRTAAGLVLRRRCRHCGEPLEGVVEPECAHLAWEVTSEYRNARHMWVKSRKCSDCGDPLEPAVELEPHWPDKALSACPGFEKEYQGESDAKRRLPRCKQCRQPRDVHPETERENDR
ncbi:hypothetical protein [Streptomyces sp. NBC_00519]|uniref:hypothetical protein n=1 Tax=Streptomyces sp. NBC_00519 TaxID=2975764 RepID=UPI0030DF1FE1